MKSLSLFLNEYYRSPNAQKAGQRMGQFFVNTYTKGPWPDLFYADNTKSLHIIEEWLIDNSYIDDLPMTNLEALQNQTLESLNRQFLRLLKLKETNDDGKEFYPTKISSCRTMDLQRIRDLLDEIERRVKV